MSKIYRCDQGSMEWYRLRMGKPTSSQFHKIITPGGKISEQRYGYMYRLIAERLLMESMEQALTVEWVERGKELEPDAVRQFMLVNEVELELVGFVTSDNGKLGCSPDRLVHNKAECVEIKCPSPWVQVGYMLDGVGSDYRPQVQGQLYVGGFDTVHFYSYHPRMPAVHIETHPDAHFQAAMRNHLDQFLDELDEMTEIARRKGAYVPNVGFSTPHEESAPGPEPLTIIVP